MCGERVCEVRHSYVTLASPFLLLLLLSSFPPSLPLLHPLARVTEESGRARVEKSVGEVRECVTWPQGEGRKGGKGS